MDILLTHLGGAQVDVPGTTWLDHISSDTGICLWPKHFLWHKILRSAGQSATALEATSTWLTDWWLLSLQCIVRRGIRPVNNLAVAVRKKPRLWKTCGVITPQSTCGVPASLEWSLTNGSAKQNSKAVQSLRSSRCVYYVVLLVFSWS